MTLDDRLDEQFKRMDGTIVLPIYNRPTAIGQAKEAILSDLLEMIPKEVDTKQYKCDDSEYSFMLGYIQACIETEEKVRKYCD